MKVRKTEVKCREAKNRAAEAEEEAREARRTIKGKKGMGCGQSVGCDAIVSAVEGDNDPQS